MSLKNLLLTKNYLRFQGIVGFRNATWEGRSHHNFRQDRGSANFTAIRTPERMPWKLLILLIFIYSVQLNAYVSIFI